jgi:hypothetical protein
MLPDFFHRRPRLKRDQARNSRESTQDTLQMRGCFCAGQKKLSAFENRACLPFVKIEDNWRPLPRCLGLTGKTMPADPRHQQPTTAGGERPNGYHRFKGKRVMVAPGQSFVQPTADVHGH